jgi:hypothetical protein
LAATSIVLAAAVDHVQFELRFLPGEHGGGAAADQVQVRQVAEGEVHVDEADRRQQEGEAEAQAQCVVDRADEQRDQHGAEQQPRVGRHDEDAPLVQEDFTGLRTPHPKQPLAGMPPCAVFEAGVQG